ncbi:hypothetical protein D6C77_02932 [Aureobasidium pullulans]|nr:hypothetical protein D6C77_02932 [Aureobasidium pullulans]
MNPGYRNARSLPPQNAWCSRCPGFRPLAAFSRSRQQRVNDLLARGARLGDKSVTSILFCNSCSGGPKLELKCTGCDKTRGINEFSSTQRNVPDTARCRKCQAEIENIKAGPLELEEDESDNEYMAKNMGKNDLSSIASAMGGVSLAPSNGFEALPSSTRSSHIPTNITTSARSSTRASTATTSSRAKLPLVEIGASGFAKVKAGHRKVLVPVMMDDDVETFEDDEDWAM